MDRVAGDGYVVGYKKDGMPLFYLFHTLRYSSLPLHVLLQSTSLLDFLFAYKYFIVLMSMSSCSA